MGVLDSAKTVFKINLKLSGRSLLPGPRFLGNHMKKNILFIYITGLIILTFTGTVSCSMDSKTFKNGYSDKKLLIKDFVNAVFKNDTKKITELLVTREEYSALIHPYVPEGNLKNGGVEADVYWRNFIINQRDHIIGSYLKRLALSNCSLTKIGDSKESRHYGKVVFYRETEFTYTCKHPNGLISEENTDQFLLGVIAKKGGKYKVLTSFRD
jgi:hypothetical protein